VQPSVNENNNSCPKCGSEISGGPQCPECGVYYEKVARKSAPLVKPRKSRTAKTIALIAVVFLGILISLSILRDHTPTEISPDRGNTGSAAADPNETSQESQRFVVFQASLVARGASAHLEGDYATALKLFRAGAEEGDARAQLFLGAMYSEGHGVPQDYGVAMRWYRLAAQQENAEAQYALGLSYDNGLGVPRNDTEAVRWFRLAAEQGYARGQLALGKRYGSGQGVAPNDAEAARWLRRAAEQGNAEAQGLLGGMYVVGRGVARDVTNAYMWWSLANAQGDEIAAQFLDRIEEHMTRDQIAEGQRLAAEAWERIGR